MGKLMLAAVLLAGLLTAARGGSHPSVALVGDSIRVAPRAQPAAVRADTSFLVAVARARTPFRVGGTPPRARWGDTPPPPPAPKPFVERPHLLLTGIIWAREPVALIEGIPGTEQAASLSVGAELHGFRVTRIDAHRALVAGQDTVWSLEVRNPWP